MTKRIFISDVHIGAGRYSAEAKNRGTHPHDWDWLNDGEKQNFVAFLDHLSRNAEAWQEVVFIGDLFDNWIYPHDLAPPTMDELLALPANAGVVQAIKALSKQLKVLYVPGNHDMHATAPVMAKHFPDVVYCPQQFVAGRLIAEHGHRYAMFNAPPDFTRNIAGLPLGYFISRIEATRKARTNSEVRHYHTYVDDAIEAGGNRSLAECVFEAMLEEAQLDEDTTEFKCRARNGEVVSISAARVKSTYADLYADWPDAIVSKARAVLAELNRLGPIADRLCKHGARKVCIFGHSHKAGIDKDALFGNERIYANTGYWCSDKTTFVEVEKKRADERIHYDVRLMQWQSGGLVEIESKQLR